MTHQCCRLALLVMIPCPAAGCGVCALNKVLSGPTPQLIHPPDGGREKRLSRGEGKEENVSYTASKHQGSFVWTGTRGDREGVGH